MSGESASELLDRVRQSGLFPFELLDELASGLTSESTPDHILQRLQERSPLTPEQMTVLAVDLPSPVESEAHQFVPVPHDDAGEAIVPTAVAPDSLFVQSAGPSIRKRNEPSMTRQTMWTWIVFGGALWLVGFLVLGIWLGGCFDSSSKSNPKNGHSAP